MRRVTVSSNASTIPAKRRLALVAGTSVRPQDILEMPDNEINYAFLRKNKVPVLNIRVSGFTPSVLRERGTPDAESMYALGFDALHLLSPDFLNDAVATYGASSLTSAFLKTPYDAVALADHQVMQTLSLSLSKLLEECAGSPAEAVAVLVQLNTLENIDATTLLDTGIRGPQLVEMGYSYAEVQSATRASNAQMGKLQMIKS